MNFKYTYFHYFCKSETEKTKQMEFKELIEKRRSIRKFSDRAVPRETVDRILRETLTAPSARNTRTTRLMVVDDPALVAAWPKCAITGRRS